MTTTARIARPGDHAAALEVWLRANTARGKTPGPDRVARVRAKLADAALVVVAERVGDVVGMALAEPGPDRDGAGEVLPELCHLSMVFVDPDHWGNRIGQPLLDAVYEQAVRQGHTLVHLWTGEDNQRARRLYDRAGFLPSGRADLLDTANASSTSPGPCDRARWLGDHDRRVTWRTAAARAPGGRGRWPNPRWCR
ncbi:GNAT family N-acetyltransferase [Amycolatopsis sp. NPDC058278]|uniref:GNAT family N-acetyltransferase n=1 Tax=Amycolatopsis sp. NPDC058278 TaxID=3346417 RepID=UPI0036D9D58B